MEGKRYFENLDWLRAYAALAVFIYHANITFMSYWQVLEYGWVWVNIFFVISGFLITNILIKNKGEKDYLTKFYFHRAIRILPLYFLCLGIVTIYWILQKYPLGDIYAYILFYQNWLIWAKEWLVEFPAMFSHSWTIAIEQQFYLIWPIIVYYSNIRFLKYFCVFWIFFWIFARFYLFEYFSWSIASYSTFSYIDTLLGWSLLALFYRTWYKLESLFRYSCMLMLLTLPFYWITANYLDIPLFWKEHITSVDAGWPLFMIVIFSASIFIVHFLLISKNTLTRYVFSNSWITYLWKISYGIYLYHVILLYIFDINWSFMLGLRKTIHLWILQVLSSFTDLTHSVIQFSFLATNLCAIFAQIAFTIFIAHISYKYFEKRFLSLK